MTAEDLARTPVDAHATGAREAVEHLRMLAIEQRLGRHVGADQLIAGALTALVLDVDSPSLRLLAGLSRREEPQAHELFAHVIDELGLAAQIPKGRPEARWALVHWWLELIADGTLDPFRGGLLIWYEGWDRLGHPAALQPLVGWTSEYEDWTEDWEIPRETFLERIIQEARTLLDGPWQPAADEA